METTQRIKVRKWLKSNQAQAEEKPSVALRSHTLPLCLAADEGMFRGRGKTECRVNVGAVGRSSDR